ncbi:MAG: DUF4136 domain-containing protein [Halieaceae bacterium]|nr:DUF4136 domain-containing protein [Halieaceae bacterium]
MRHTVRLLFKALATLTVAGLAAGCATSPPEPRIDYNTQYDFRKIKTFAFLPQSGGTSGDSPKVFISDMVANRIDLGLERAMQTKGFTFVKDPNQADVLLSWHLVAQEKTDIRTYNTGPTYGGYYGGYRGYSRSAYYNCWNCGTNVTVRNYTQGTFIVDIIDPQLKQSVFRSVIQTRLKGEESRDQLDYDTGAANILKGFPPY